MKFKRQCWSHVQGLCSCVGVPSFRPTILTASFRFLEREWTVAAMCIYALCGPRFQRHTAVTGTLRFPLRASWRAAPRSSPRHASSRADAILVASRCLSPLESQPQLSDKRWAHGQDGSPSYGLCSLHHHHATLEFSTMVSGVLSRRFITLLAVSEDVGSHSVSASNKTADNTRIISILSDMTLVVGA